MCLPQNIKEEYEAENTNDDCKTHWSCIIRWGRAIKSRLGHCDIRRVRILSSPTTSDVKTQFSHSGMIIYISVSKQNMRSPRNVVHDWCPDAPLFSHPGVFSYLPPITLICLSELHRSVDTARMRSFPATYWSTSIPELPTANWIVESWFQL